MSIGQEKIVSTSSDRAGNKRHVIVYVQKDNLLAASYSDDDGISWSPARTLVELDKTWGTPALEFFQDSFYLVYRRKALHGGKDDHLSRATSSDGIHWEADEWLAGRTDSTPCLVQWLGLNLFWQGAGNDHILWFAISKDGSNWSTQASISTITPFFGISAMGLTFDMVVYYTNKQGKLCYATSKMVTAKEGDWNINETDIKTSQIIEIVKRDPATIFVYFVNDDDKKIWQGELIYNAHGKLEKNWKINNINSATTPAAIKISEGFLLLYKDRTIEDKLVQMFCVSPMNPTAPKGQKSTEWCPFPRIGGKGTPISICKGGKDEDRLFALFQNSNQSISISQRRKGELYWGRRQEVEIDNKTCIRCTMHSDPEKLYIVMTSDKKIEIISKNWEAGKWRLFKEFDLADCNANLKATLTGSAGALILCYVDKSKTICMLYETSPGQFTGLSTSFITNKSPTIFSTTDNVVHLFYFNIKDELKHWYQYPGQGLTETSQLTSELIKQMPIFSPYHNGKILMLYKSGVSVYSLIGGRVLPPTHFEIQKPIEFPEFTGFDLSRAAIILWGDKIHMISGLQDHDQNVFVDSTEEIRFDWHLEEVSPNDSSFSTPPVIQSSPDGNEMIIIWRQDNTTELQLMAANAKVMKWKSRPINNKIKTITTISLFKDDDILYLSFIDNGYPSFSIWDKKTEFQTIIISPNKRKNATSLAIVRNMMDEPMVLLARNLCDVYDIKRKKWFQTSFSDNASCMYFNSNQTLTAITHEFNGGTLTRSYWDGIKWKFNTDQVLKQVASDSPEFIIFNGKECLIWKKFNDVTAMYSFNFDFNGKNVEITAFECSSRVSAIVLDGILHITFRNVQKKIMYGQGIEHIQWQQLYTCRNSDKNEYWMTDNYQGIKFRKLHRLILPGSHDSGCYDFTSYIQYTAASWGFQTQTLSLYDQLKAGVRYLDIRFGLEKKRSILRHTEPEFTYIIHHQHAYTNITLSTFIKQIRAFAMLHPTELFIVHLTHFQNCTESEDFQRFYIALFYGLKEFLCPFQRDTTFQNLAGKGTIILSTEHDVNKQCYRYPPQIRPFIWKDIDSPYSEDLYQERNPEKVKEWIEQYQSKPDITEYFWVAQCIQTPVLSLVVTGDSVEKLSSVINRMVPTWVKSWKNKCNIILSDYITEEFVAELIEKNF